MSHDNVFSSLNALEHAYHLASIYAACSTISLILLVFMAMFIVMLVAFLIFTDTDSVQAHINHVKTALAICVSIFICSLPCVILIPDADVTRNAAMMKYKQSTGLDPSYINFSSNGTTIQDNQH